MESTKVISLRIDRKFYNEILLECNEKDIGVSVWLETNIALAQKKKVDKEYLLSQLRIMEKIAHAQSPILEVRIKYLREYIENEPTAAVDMDEMIRLEKIKKYKALIADSKNDDNKKRWAEKVAILEKGR